MRVDGRTSKIAAGAAPTKALGAENLMKLTAGLAEGFPERTFGTPQAEAAAQWVADQLTQAGCEPLDGKLLHGFDWKMTKDLTLRGHNVAGVLKGTDPKLRDEYVIVAAHHDSQQVTQAGANDNATGCAAVIAVAQALAKNPPKRSVMFVTFDGEEGLRIDRKYHGGRRGSKAYAANPLEPLAQTAMLVNIDMIGQVHLESGSRNDVFSWASNDAFAKGALERAAQKALRPHERSLEGYPEQPKEAQFFTTDAEPLYALNVPVLNFLSGRDLDNHQPADDMSRIIPERIEQYTRLIHASVLEAANHPESIRDMKLRPGTAKSDYELINARRSTGTRSIDEQRMRHASLGARLPELAAASLRVLEEIDREGVKAQTGLSLDAIEAKATELVSEPALAAVRAVRAEAVEAFREIPKDDRAARLEGRDRLRVLSGVEDVLAAAVFLNKLDSKGDYYLGRIPSALASLDRGARRLGLAHGLEGVVQQSDVQAFLPEVSADRAVSVAREGLAALGKTAGRSVYALLNPYTAAEQGSRPVEPTDVEMSMQRISEALGGVGADEAQISAFSNVVGTQLAHVRGSGHKWLERFAKKNILTDFEVAAALVHPHDEPLRALGRELNERISSRLEAEAATLAFYRRAAELTIGPAGAKLDLETLSGLSRPGKLEAFVEAGLRTGAESALDAKDGEVKKARAGVVDAAIGLQALFHPKSGELAPEVGLGDVSAALSRLERAVSGLEHGEPVARELAFWSEWLQPFLELELPALHQQRERMEATADGIIALEQKVWPKVQNGLLAKVKLPDDVSSPEAIAKHLRARMAGDEDEAVLAGAALKQLLPYVNALSALRASASTKSPEAEARLSSAVAKLEGVAGAEAFGELRAAVERLTGEQVGPKVRLGRRAQRSGPMRVSSVR